MSALRWASGSDAVRRAVDAWWADGARTGVLRENDRRRVARVDAAQPLFVKQFRAHGGGHRLRETLKAWIGRSPASREARHLHALGDAGVRVPALLGDATASNGDRVLVLPALPGASLRDAVARATPAERRALFDAIGRAVHALHARGFAHGDLHGENLLVGDDGPWIVDLQHARAGASREAQLQDLGDLDYSLWGRATRGDRLRLRRAALGGDASREALHAVGDAALRRADAHGRSRTRHATRPGREMARVRAAGWRGLQRRAVPPGVLREAFDLHRAALADGGAGVLKDDGRSAITRVAVGEHRFVVKQVRARGFGRALADAFRGSAAFRGFRGGHGLRVRGIGAARPEAWIERRRLGLPVESILFLEDLGARVDAVALDDPKLLEARVAALLEALHLRRVVHGDLKGSHLLFSADGARADLIDLEGVRFERKLDDDARIAALAQLNASLPDRIDTATRERIFRRYCCALPFDRGADAAREAIVRRSLERRHRWTGGDCTLR